MVSAGSERLQRVQRRHRMDVHRMRPGLPAHRADQIPVHRQDELRRHVQTRRLLRQRPPAMEAQLNEQGNQFLHQRPGRSLRLLPCHRTGRRQLLREGKEDLSRRACHSLRDVGRQTHGKGLGQLRPGKQELQLLGLHIQPGNMPRRRHHALQPLRRPDVQGRCRRHHQMVGSQHGELERHHSRLPDSKRRPHELQGHHAPLHTQVRRGLQRSAALCMDSQERLPCLEQPQLRRHHLLRMAHQSGGRLQAP